MLDPRFLSRMESHEVASIICQALFGGEASMALEMKTGEVVSAAGAYTRPLFGSTGALFVEYVGWFQ